MKAIDVSHVTKIYRRYARRRQFSTLKSAILSGTMIRDLKPEETFPALKDVSFTVEAGRTYGIIGRNGSGKSTALKIVAGITKPTSGTVKVQGRISALIELGAGFHPEISGRENVYINGIMLGLSKREIARRFDEIVEFAELQDFIDAPVKTYSSGMYMRLGFAVAIHVDPDVLLVDEVLAVGDEGFTHKCLDKFGEFRRRGKTVLLVTHSLGLVERFCDEVLWLDGGQAKADGDPRRVVGMYVTAIEKSEERQLARDDQRARDAAEIRARAGGGHRRAGEPRRGGRTADRHVPGDRGPVGLARGRDHGRDADGRGRPARPRVPVGRARHHQAGHQGERTAAGLRARRRDVQRRRRLHLRHQHRRRTVPPDSLSGEGCAEFVVDALDLVEGTYKLDVAIHKRDGYPYDYHRSLYTFRVKSRTKDVGIYRPRHRWEFTRGIRFRLPEY